MKVTTLIALGFLFVCSPALAEVVTTTDGRLIKLNSDGTYKVLSQPPLTSDTYYQELNLAEFELFEEDWIGRAVWVARSSFDVSPITKSNIQSGRITINAGTGTSPHLLTADISTLSREDQVNLVRGDRYMAFGTIKKITETASTGGAAESLILDVDLLIFDSRRILRIRGGDERVPVSPE